MTAKPANVAPAVRFRAGIAIGPETRGMTLRELLTEARIAWHGVRLNQPDWSAHSHSLALSVQDGRKHYYLVMNAYWESLQFELPPVPAGTAGWLHPVPGQVIGLEDARGIGHLSPEPDTTQEQAWKQDEGQDNQAGSHHDTPSRRECRGQGMCLVRIDPNRQITSTPRARRFRRHPRRRLPGRYSNITR